MVACLVRDDVRLRGRQNQAALLDALVVAVTIFNTEEGIGIMYLVKGAMSETWNPIIPRQQFRLFVSRLIFLQVLFCYQNRRVLCKKSQNFKLC